MLVRLERARDNEHWKRILDTDLQPNTIMDLFEYQADYFFAKRPKQTTLHYITSILNMKASPDPPFGTVLSPDSGEQGRPLHGLS